MNKKRLILLFACCYIICFIVLSIYQHGNVLSRVEYLSLIHIYIALAAPVSHIWYFKGIPSRMGLILDISPRTLEKVLYFASYIVLDPGSTSLQLSLIHI